MTKAVETTPPREAPTTFEGLVTSLRGRIQRAALLLCGDADEAEELAQETFVRAWMGWSQFGLRSAVFSWVYGILLNVWRESLRRRKRRELGPEPLAGPAEGGAIAREEAELVRRAIGGLSEEHREAIVLHYMQDLSLAEVASLLGIPDGTAKSRLHAARAAVRGELERMGWKAEDGR